MPRFAMVATDTIDRAGIVASPGDIIDVSPIYAAMLTYHKLARFATAADYVTRQIDPDPDPPAPAPEPDPPPPPIAARNKRTYRRRDMRPER